MNRRPVLHLSLNFTGEQAPALGTIWDFILSDTIVLQNIRMAAAQGNDVAITAVTGPTGVLALRPHFNVRQAPPDEFAEHDAYIPAPSAPAGAAEVRLHLTGQHASVLAVLLHRCWPQQRQKAG